MIKKQNFSETKIKAWKCNDCGHVEIDGVTTDYKPQSCSSCEERARNTQFFRNADRLVGAKITKILRDYSTSSVPKRDDIIAKTDKNLTLYIRGIEDEEKDMWNPKNKDKIPAVYFKPVRG